MLTEEDERFQRSNAFIRVVQARDVAHQCLIDYYGRYEFFLIEELFAYDEYTYSKREPTAHSSAYDIIYLGGFLPGGIRKRQYANSNDLRKNGAIK